MSDLIEREAAITIPVMPKQYRHYQTMNIDDVYEKGWRDCQKCIERHLPPAQPDSDEWCHDCKEYDTEKHCCPRFNRVIRTAVQEADETRIQKAYELGKLDAQLKTGRWIYTPGMNEQCSACGQYFPLSYFKDRPFDVKYCPHCGARMEDKE